MNKVDEIIKILKESKLTTKRWKDKWCYWFKEEFEEYPEAELLLRKVLENQFAEVENHEDGDKNGNK